MRFARLAALILLSLVLIASPLAVEAQPAKVARVGWLNGEGVFTPNGPLTAELLRGLREQGYTEGENLAIEYRSAEGGTRPSRPWSPNWSGSRWMTASRAGAHAHGPGSSMASSSRRRPPPPGGPLSSGRRCVCSVLTARWTSGGSSSVAARCSSGRRPGSSRAGFDG